MKIIAPARALWRACRLSAVLLLGACEMPPPATLGPIPPAARADVYIRQDTRLGRRLLVEYGEAKVPWCRAATAGGCNPIFVRSITEKEAIAKLRRFTNDRRDGWETSVAGPPVPVTELRFYDGRGEIVGTLGSGSDFFEGAMLYRRTSRAEMDAYLRMLGLSRDDIR